MNADTPAIAIDCVQFRYGRLGPRRRNAPLVLKDISLSVSAGDILCLLGPSGCGKTTLVNLVMGVDVPTSGTVRVLSEVAPFRTARARIGFMPQDDALYEDITAEENLRFFAALYGVKGERLARRMDELFAFVRLEAHRKKLVHDYSGGMKRRLSLAVALVHEPSVLVLDEPTVGLGASPLHLEPSGSAGRPRVRHRGNHPRHGRSGALRPHRHDSRGTTDRRCPAGRHPGPYGHEHLGRGLSGVGRIGGSGYGCETRGLAAP